MEKWEINFLRNLLRFSNPKRVLEWGSGFSTFYFSRHLAPDALWDSIEHNHDWYTKLKKIKGFKQINLHYIAHNNFPYTDNHQDGSYEDFQDYIEYPKAAYDFIIIDGRARLDCIKKSLSCLNKTGIVFLHDANRTYYHHYLDKFNYHFLIRSNKYLDNGGVWVGSQSNIILKFKKEILSKFSKKFLINDDGTIKKPLTI